MQSMAILDVKHSWHYFLKHSSDVLFLLKAIIKISF